ncbi:MAG: hypothetical protein K2I03_08085 [Lachnospiraceae bacterium]|nr:hypothetical protein [Lachnospiraceae bacterium]
MKDVFSYNSDVNKTAYMNWRTNHHDHIFNMIVIADGFMNSAIMLAEAALEDNWDKKADSIVYPMLFNANHAIELYLKAAVWTLNILLDNEQKIEGKHNIQQILQTLIKRVQTFESDKDKRKQFKDMINGTKLYVNELFQKIESQDGKGKKDNMDFSRYPLDEHYIPHFYINEFDNVVIDLENFIVRFKEIGENLHLISTHYLFNVLESED